MCNTQCTALTAGQQMEPVGQPGPDTPDRQHTYARRGELDREQTRPLMEKNRKIMDTELGKILTDAQKAKLKDMGGKPFTQEPEEDGGL